MVGSTTLSCQFVHDELNLHSTKLTFEKKKKKNEENKRMAREKMKKKKKRVLLLLFLSWTGACLTLQTSGFWRRGRQ